MFSFLITNSHVISVCLKNIVVHTLGHADDEILLNTDIEVVTVSITAITKGSREDVDMHISISKTKVMHMSTKTQ